MVQSIAGLKTFPRKTRGPFFCFFVFWNVLRVFPLGTPSSTSFFSQK
jgi:hypothetical protein